MILFCDTSALMKLLVDEAQSEQMRQLQLLIGPVGCQCSQQAVAGPVEAEHESDWHILHHPGVIIRLGPARK